MTAPVLLLAALLAASPELEEGRLAYSGFKYAKAIQKLTPLAERADAPAPERVEAFDLIARSHLALGHAAAAEQAYDALLAIDPMAADPQGSPKIRKAFTSAKRKRFPENTVTLTRAPSGADVLEVRVVNPWRAPLRVELMESKEGAPFAPRELPLTGERAVAALKPGSRNFVRAVSPDGQTVLAKLGEDAPFAGPLPPPPPEPPPAVAAAAPPPAQTRTPADAPRKTAPSLTPATSTPSPATQPPKKPAEGSTLRTTALVMMGVGLVVVLTGAVMVFSDFSNGRWRDADELGPLYQRLDGWTLGWSATAGLGVLSVGVGALLFGADWLNTSSGRLNLIL